MMKITRGQLKQIIKEEIAKTMKPLNEGMYEAETVEEAGCGQPQAPAPQQVVQQERVDGARAPLAGIDKLGPEELIELLAKKMSGGDPRKSQEVRAALQHALKTRLNGTVGQ